jgi:hypothetical protein
MNIEYSRSRSITTAEFFDVLRRSTVGERRPIDDLPCIESMLKHANLLCTPAERRIAQPVRKTVTLIAADCRPGMPSDDFQVEVPGVPTAPSLSGAPSGVFTMRAM